MACAKARQQALAHWRQRMSHEDIKHVTARSAYDHLNSCEGGKGKEGGAELNAECGRAAVSAAAGARMGCRGGGGSQVIRQAGGRGGEVAAETQEGGTGDDERGQAAAPQLLGILGISSNGG